MSITLLRQHFNKILLTLILFTQASVYAQPTFQWQRKLSTNNGEYDVMNTYLETPDGGYIMAGQMDSGMGGDKTEPSRGGTDYWVVKLRADRSIEWNHTYGGDNTDILYSVLPTSDGGYILGGYSNSDKGGEKSEDCKSIADQEGYLGPDYWIVKITADGTKQWDKTYGGTGEDLFVTMKHTLDGGFLIGGTANGGYNILKINLSGDLQWEKEYKGQGGYNILGSIIQTSDGGFIMAGGSSSGKGFSKTEGSKGRADYWIIKTDEQGVIQWDKTYGGSEFDDAGTVFQTKDGGYVITGSTNSPISWDKTEAQRGTYDTWVLKLDSKGSLLWEKTVGGSRYLAENVYYTGASGLSVYEEKSNGDLILAGNSSGKASPEKTSDAPGAWMVTLNQRGRYVKDTSLQILMSGFVKTKDNGFLLGGRKYEIAKFLDPNAPKPAPETIRINSGGPAFTTGTKKLFIADRYYAGIDRTNSIPSGDILNTTNDVLYRSGRCSPSFSYNIPVQNGKVDVTLHFSETYYGAPGKKGGKGSRQFNVNMEGSRKLTNFDIYVAAGGAMKAYQRTFPVTVTDGVLNIDFLTGAADLPRVSAIEVVPVTNLTLQPLADAYVQDGTYNKANFGATDFLDVKKSSSNLSANRSAYLKFQLPVAFGITSAKLRIYGHNHENTNNISVHAYGVNNDSWTENIINKYNAPGASTASLGYVSVNNVYKYYEIDITAYVKSQQQSGDQVVTLLLQDPNNRNTRLVFNSKENGANPPQLIVQNSPMTISNSREGVEEVIAEVEEEITIFPNPASETLNINVNDWNTVKRVEIFNNHSTLIYSSGEKPTQNIDIHTLKSGIHFVRILKSDGSFSIQKLLIAK